MEERETRGGVGAAVAAETLGVTQASGTPRPLGSGSKESREPARRQRTMGVGTLWWVGSANRSCEAWGPRLSPQAFPLHSKLRRLGVMGKT